MLRILVAKKRNDMDTGNFTSEQKELYDVMLQAYGVLLSQKEAAKVLRVSPTTLFRMRVRGVRPKHIKLLTASKSKSHRVMYPLQEIVKYLTEPNA